MNRIAYSLLCASLAFASTAAWPPELKYSLAPNFFDHDPDHQPLGPCHGGVVTDKAGIFMSRPTPRAASWCLRRKANSCAPLDQHAFTAWNFGKKVGRNTSTRRAQRTTKWLSSISPAKLNGRSVARWSQAFIRKRKDSIRAPSPSDPMVPSSSPMVMDLTTS